jgi:hypothetical protein
MGAGSQGKRAAGAFIAAGLLLAGMVVTARSDGRRAGAVAPTHVTDTVRTFTCSREGCRAFEAAPCCAAPAPTEAPLFRSGEIDLTGDGVPERVVREGTQVLVEEDGVEVWRTPPHWNVVDAALGDPNDDGRNEILLAFWRPDDTGAPGSHPFIVGYRGGIYRTLWGGSAVADPIHEVALGDVDGDGAQNLVVIEASGADRAVAVWRWHGWGFSLVWRSAPGPYRDLSILPGEGGVPDTIRVTVDRP